MSRIAFLISLCMLALMWACSPGESPSVAALTPQDVEPQLIDTSIGVTAGSQTPSVEISMIIVPRGTPGTIDGIMSPGEWDNARIETFADGSELFFMHNEGYLYLAIRASSSEMIVGNVFLDQGDKISILHSSAALGTAQYERNVEGWQQAQNFAWRCRMTDDSDAALAERAAFLEEERWIAANALMGTPNELEYQIEMSNVALRMAVNFIRSSNRNEKIPWPTELDDDVIKPTPGGLPAEMFFSPEKWAILDLSE